MAVYTWDALYLGNAADMDTNENTFGAETPEDLLGTYGSVGDPLYDDVVTVVVDDAADDTNITTDSDASPDSMTIDGVAHTLDSGAVYNATITYVDGSTATITAVVMQTTDGDLYLAPEMSQNADFDAMEAAAIRSISLDSVSVQTTNIAANRSSTNFVCFVHDTRIATPFGDRLVSELAVGDLVLTVDRGAQPIRWIGSTSISVARQLTDPRSAPITIEAVPGGLIQPARPLSVSPQHRILVTSRIAERMFGTPEVLVAAKKLTRFAGIAPAPAARPVTYVHLAFDHHEVLFANGVAAESLFPGSETAKMFGTRLMSELYSQIGVDRHGSGHYPAARPIPTGRRLETFLVRLARKLDRQSERNCLRVGDA